MIEVVLVVAAVRRESKLKWIEEADVGAVMWFWRDTVIWAFSSRCVPARKMGKHSAVLTGGGKTPKKNLWAIKCDKHQSGLNQSGLSET